MKKFITLFVLLYLFSPTRIVETLTLKIKLNNDAVLVIPLTDSQSVIIDGHSGGGLKFKGDHNSFISDNNLVIKGSDLPESLNGEISVKITTEDNSLFPLARSQIGPFGGTIHKALTINDYTNASGQQIFVVMGDSKTAFSSDTDQASPSPTTGTAWQLNNTTNAIVALTSTDLINAGNAGANRGSPWPQFCITYNSLTNGVVAGQIPGGYKPVIVDGHMYGSYWSNATASLSWDTNGTLYETMRDRTYRAMNLLGLKKPAGIFITLGINDNSSATAIATVTANMQAIINRLAADFGSDVPVYVAMPGTDNNTPTARTGLIRSAIRDLSINNSNVYEDLNENCLYSWGLMDATPLHWTMAGDNKVGVIRANYAFNTWGLTDKDSRRIVYNMYDAINSSKVSAINAYVTGLKSDGIWTSLDALHQYIGDTEKNILIDWVGRSGPLKPTNAFTFNANANISTDGVSTYLRTWYLQSALAKYATQNDGGFGIGMGTVTTPAGTAGRAFGTAAGNAIYLGQNASSQTTFLYEQATPQTYPTDNKLQDNTNYVEQRTSSTAFELIKNGTSVSTKSVASTGFASLAMDVGCTNNANPDTPTTGTFLNATYRHWYAFKASTFNISSFNTRQATLETALAIP
jgi:hypothetical protein